MIKYKFLLILIFVSSVFFSQQKDYAFSYRLEYTPDSTDVLNTRMEDFTLFVNGGKSFFVSDNFLKRDSILKSFEKSPNFNFSKKPNTRFKSVIVKENKNISFYDNLLKYYFTYKEDPNFKWNILTDKQKIEGYNTQKATTEYGGRKWVAWFTTDLPYQDGPYKFGGLPGLIIKVEDTNNNYKYELISIKKKSLPDNVIFTEKYLKQHKEVSKEDYMKAMKNINDNMINEAAMTGLTIAPESLEQVKKNLSKRNNPIELKK
ncbi:GLPGLI family protein [Chryseobacterium sp. WG14]|uniref:GLPGLI family protein n=1 Tax=Chryseobacterium sp. WG14 TaxID=2926909 RepID=UPI00211F3214|nr:GLPGLI family protein [Chryseobacterium sp. WG14]MCQ9638945.1 GLPGLI family protein [Chryseobacterium sp. WG14]